MAGCHGTVGPASRHGEVISARAALHLPPSPFRRSCAIATTVVAPPTWTIKDAEKLYNMSGWGLGYFRVNAEGHVTVHPDANRKRGLDLYQLAMDLNAQGVGLPLLLRFSDILRSRIEALAAEFASAIKEFGYEGSYTTVYPIKVNQQRHVVQEIVEFGAPARRGPRVRQQAGAPGHPRPQREHQPPHRLQRLQGRGVHAAGPHGPEARATR